MSLNGIYTIFLKDLKSAVKDKTILFLLAVPIIISLVIPLLVSSTGSMVASIAVYDEGNSGDFIDHLKSFEYYNVTVVDSADTLKEMTDQGDTVAAIVIPPRFSEDIKQGSRPSLQILINPSKTQSIVFTQSYKDIIMDYSGQAFPANITMETTGESGFGDLARSSIVPLLILISTVILGITILPYTLTTEKEKKTLDAVLVSPTSEGDVIFGKTLFGLSITMAISLLVFIISGGLTGNVPAMLLFTFLGSLAFNGIGLLIASYTNNYSTASVASSIVMLPMMLIPMLGAFVKEAEVIADLFPSTYMYNGISDAIYGNGSIQGMLVGLLVLAGFNVAIYALTIYLIRKRRLEA
jgi:ABC-2 type transport system permease protein